MSEPTLQQEISEPHQEIVDEKTSEKGGAERGGEVGG